MNPMPKRSVPFRGGAPVEQHPAAIGITDPDQDAQDYRHFGVEQLLVLMRSGNRDAAAEFVTRFGSRIRRRIRGKLGQSMRRLFDSQEILSTVGRRLDLYVKQGKLQATGEGQLWSLVFKMADNALVDKVRVHQRLQSVEGSDAQFARDMLKQLRDAESRQSSSTELEIDHVLRMLPDRADRLILSRWLNGERHTDIADELGMNATGVRKRWQNIKHLLRRHFDARLDQ